jgi:hypothetical protein
VLAIVKTAPHNPYQRRIFAVGMVEGNCDTLAYNPAEAATGYFQVDRRFA